MTLPEIRKKIDALDAKLIALLNERADLVHEVGQLKKRDGLAIYAPEREEQLLQSLVQMSKVYSHPQVFGQCRQWLRHNLPHADLIEVASTTHAAELAAKEPDAAAIAGQMAAEVYGLNILERSIQDSPDNTTRFLVISRNTCPPTGNDKTSLMFCVQDKPGALFSAI